MQHGRGQFSWLLSAVLYAENKALRCLPKTMYEVHKGDDAGWPYIYYDPFQKKKIVAPEYGGDGKKNGGRKDH